jgi:hypothetical protein
LRKGALGCRADVEQVVAAFADDIGQATNDLTGFDPFMVIFITDRNLLFGGDSRRGEG